LKYIAGEGEKYVPAFMYKHLSNLSGKTGLEISQDLPISSAQWTSFDNSTYG